MIGVAFEPKTIQIECFVLNKSSETKKVLRGTFWKVQRIQIHKYPKTYIEPKYGAFYLNKQSQGPWISFISSTELESSFL